MTALMRLGTLETELEVFENSLLHRCCSTIQISQDVIPLCFLDAVKALFSDNFLATDVPRESAKRSFIKATFLSFQHSSILFIFNPHPVGGR